MKKLIGCLLLICITPELLAQSRLNAENFIPTAHPEVDSVRLAVRHAPTAASDYEFRLNILDSLVLSDYFFSDYPSLWCYPAGLCPESKPIITV